MLTMGTRQRLEDHIKECSGQYKRLRKQMASSDQDRAERFAALAVERDRMHAENVAAVSELRGIVWKFGFAILTALLALAGSHHI